VITKEVERRVPSLRSAPIIGAALELRHNYLGTLLRAAREVGGIAQVHAGRAGLIARTSRCQIRMDPSSVMVQPGLCATSHT